MEIWVEMNVIHVNLVETWQTTICTTERIHSHVISSTLKLNILLIGKVMEAMEVSVHSWKGVEN